MTKHDCNIEPASNRIVSPFASRARSRALIAGGLLVAAVVGASLVAQQSGLAHRASLVSSRGQPRPAIEHTKIVPADAVGAVVSWSPLTGDGSN